MKDLKNNELNSNKQVSELSPVSTGRRQLTKAGLIAPVLMSFSSRPAWAAVACSASGMLSGNLSGPFESCDNSALSVGYWDANRGQWGGLEIENINTFFSLGGFFQGSDTFEHLFNGTASAYTGSGKEHCADNAAFVVQLVILLKEAITSILNAQTFPNYPLTEANIKSSVSAAYSADNSGSCSTSNIDLLIADFQALNNVNLGNEGLLP
jgi:hypothetical protein